MTRRTIIYVSGGGCKKVLDIRDKMSYTILEQLRETFSEILMETQFYPNYSKKRHQIWLDPRAEKIVEKYMEKYGYTFTKALNLYLINSSMN